MFEFTLITKKQEIEIYDSIEKLMPKLSIFFSLEKESEKSKAEIFIELYKYLTQVKYRKMNEALVTIKQVKMS